MPRELPPPAVRPTGVRRCVPLLLAVLALVAGCGQASSPGPAADRATGSAAAGPSSSPSGAAGSDEVVPGCAADTRAVTTAAVVAELDLDGDGSTEQVAWTGRAGAAGACANALVATVDGHTSGVALDDGQTGLDDAEVVDLGDRQLLLVRGPAHPRGGYPLHLYGVGPDGLGEVLSGGQPLLGFVATDGGAAPATAVCTSEGGIATMRATAARRDGVTWDVRRTTYALQGNHAVRQSSRTVVSDAPDPLLRERMPQLFDPGAYLRDCARPVRAS